MSEDHQSNDPWHLISAHQYEKAIAAYDAILAAGENYHAIVANRAIARLCLGRLSEVLEGFATANDIARRDRSAPKSAPYLSDIGTVLWLMGHRSVAMELYRSAADGIRYGTIAYADASGGVGEGLLLWYAGITTKDRNAMEQALDCLTRLAKKPRIKSWPGPLAQFVLERQSFNEVLRDPFKTNNLLETAEQRRATSARDGSLFKPYLFSERSVDNGATKMVVVELYSNRGETPPACAQRLVLYSVGENHREGEDSDDGLRIRPTRGSRHGSNLHGVRRSSGHGG
jgi:hypothetical protein